MSPTTETPPPPPKAPVDPRLGVVRSALIVPGAVVIAMTLVGAVIHWVFVVVAVAVVAITAAAIRSRLAGAVEVMVAAFESRPLSPEDAPRWQNLVDGVAVVGGLARPEIHVVDDPAPNVGVAADGAGRSLVIVTTALVDQMKRIEQEALVARALVQVGHPSTVEATLRAAFAGWPMVAPPSPPPAEVVADLDRGAVAVTRYPPGLAAAFERALAGPTGPAGCPTLLVGCWVLSPAEHAAGSHPPLADRIDTLREL